MKKRKPSRLQQAKQRLRFYEDTLKALLLRDGETCLSVPNYEDAASSRLVITARDDRVDLRAEKAHEQETPTEP